VKYIDELDLKNKTVFIRADLNVPLNSDGSIADDHRIKASLPTISFALGAGAKIVLASHLGRPKGKDASLSLKPVALQLAKLTNVKVTLADDCIGDSVKNLADNLAPKEILLLENLRFHKEEEKNDAEFAKQLAELAQVYVNDAFATAHRAHASTEGITHYLKEKAGGFTLKNELMYFERALGDPKRPLVTIFGGAKVSSKMEAIRNVGAKSDRIIIGGAMANTFFVAQGYNLGTSLVEPEQVENAKEIEKQLSNSGCELILPVDLVVAKAMKSGVTTRTCALDQVQADEMALDIGPRSISLFTDALNQAETIVWNGPMGAFEIEEFSKGTFAIVKALCDSKALTVVGGGDTDLALNQCNAFDKMGYVSTAGGAFLELLEGKVLPAVAALG
jgi:phosphoglycerate kinase